MVFKPVLNPPIRIVNPGIYILSGIIDVRINRSQLQLGAGIFENVDTLRITKGMKKIRRLVLLGHSGSISLKALRWLHDVRAGIIQIDYDGSIILASAQSRLDLPSMRRSQALEAIRPVGLKLVKYLISRKITEQANLSRQMGKDDNADEIISILNKMETCRSISDVRVVESHAAAVYWNSWSTIPVLFARKDQRRIPDEWSSFGNRTSPLSNSPRKAATPANAILNYLYALLEAESRIACLTMGLDPGVGMMHADQRGRASFSLDIMEPARPMVDAWLYQLLDQRCFSKDDFFTTSEGQVKLCKPLAHDLSETLPLWSKAVAPMVEWVARRLSGRVISTKLTQRLRSQSRPRINSHTFTKRNKSQRKFLPLSCRECGRRIAGSELYCSHECLNEYRVNVQHPKFVQAGPAALQHQRSTNQDPAHGGTAALKRSSSNQRRAAARKAWNADHTPADAELARSRFTIEILPALSDLTVTGISRETGLSLRYASLIRSGACIPHPCLHPTFDQLLTNQAKLQGKI